MPGSNFVRVTRRNPCPICEKSSWCLVSRDGGAAICPRVEEGAVKRIGDAGWLHRLNSDHDWQPRQASRRVTIRDEHTDLNFPALTAQFREAADPAALSALATQLSLSIECLGRLGVGWASRDALHRAGTKCLGAGAFSFPMSDIGGTPIGIRLRTRPGFKFSVTGSRQGLFMPADLPDDELLLTAEGATDTAALVDLGFAAVGRPSCCGGTELVIQCVKSRHPHEIVVVADADEVGRRGARTLASALRAYCPVVRVLLPPEGVKDARAWTRAGATRDDIVAAIQQSPAIGLSVSARIGRAS